MAYGIRLLQASQAWLPITGGGAVGICTSDPRCPGSRPTRSHPVAPAWAEHEIRIEVGRGTWLGQRELAA